MRVATMLCFCIIGLSLSGATSAEIYQSKDAQGNTVFSDKPSEGAQTVDLPKTNAADPVVEKPRPVETAEPPAPKKVAAKPAKPVQRAKDVDDDYRHDDYYYDGYNYNGNGNKDDDENPRKDRPRRDDDSSKPGKDRPQATPHRNSSQPVSRPAMGGGGGRR